DARTPIQDRRRQVVRVVRYRDERSLHHCAAYDSEALRSYYRASLTHKHHYGIFSILLSYAASQAAYESSIPFARSIRFQRLIRSGVSQAGMQSTACLHQRPREARPLVGLIAVAARAGFKVVIEALAGHTGRRGWRRCPTTYAQSIT